VGRGVVHACRLSSGPSSTLQTTNATFQRLQPHYQGSKGFEPTVFVSKEYRAEDEVVMYRFFEAPSGWGRTIAELSKICSATRTDANPR
jgi:hypothetical protein